VPPENENGQNEILNEILKEVVAAMEDAAREDDAPKVDGLMCVYEAAWRTAAIRRGVDAADFGEALGIIEEAGLVERHGEGTWVPVLEEDDAAAHLETPNGHAGDRPVSWDLEPGEASTVEELRARREADEGVRF
jgi:hypothetical protein